jgi:hypothetical protein
MKKEDGKKKQEEKKSLLVAARYNARTPNDRKPAMLEWELRVSTVDELPSLHESNWMKREINKKYAVEK